MSVHDLSEFRVRHVDRWVLREHPLAEIFFTFLLGHFPQNVTPFVRAAREQRTHLSTKAYTRSGRPHRRRLGHLAKGVTKEYWNAFGERGRSRARQRPTELELGTIFGRYRFLCSFWKEGKLPQFFVPKFLEHVRQRQTGSQFQGSADPSRRTVSEIQT
ncbi:hypothetical protein CEXT_181041 [Caerostris extrusa]|uniref:Maturase K n=1 Tax=Caerostris extrusa TaxID=172846 RepID=A0AAV4MRI8_CAEEX|nr:hypothetical protein CEXT_181041 [Caerostris extrusa]